MLRTLRFMPFPLVLLVMSQACSGPTSGTEDDGSGDSSDGAGPGSGGASSGGTGHSGGSGHTGGTTSTGSTSNSGATSSGSAGGEASSGGSQNNSGGSQNNGGGTATAQEVAAKLGRDHFLIGMGNDLADDHNNDGAYTLGTTLDLHYAYLVGLKDQGGWTDWNPGGYFATILADVAKSKGVVPMFTLYSMAAFGEGNAAAVTDDAYMKAYWEGAQLLFQRLGDFDGPAVVHFEPDWWAFTQQQAPDPSAMAVKIAAFAPDCAGLPETMVGMGKCLVTLARKYAPKTLIGFHASEWANPDAVKIGEYLAQIGGSEADMVVIDMLDRDAGCFEVGNDPNCTRTDGPWYWDESNQTHPNFHDHQAFSKTVGDTLGKPILWWQIPFGVPSDTPGGTPGAYRDNRVHYIFSHIDEYVAIGGVGAVFGVGSGNQTYITSDGGQFQDAVTEYFQAPYVF